MRGTAMLLIESNEERRNALVAALRAAGNDVTAVASMTDCGQWPSGQVVIVESAAFTPWWKHVGATTVLVLADTSDEGIAACARGATAWVPRHSPPEAVLAALRSTEGG
jgi:hypothetical protein